MRQSRVPFWCRCAAVAAAGAASVPVAPIISGMVMAQQCRLSAPLTLKDTQGGVVGPTGTVWTIAEDCSYAVARQIGFKTLAPKKRGRLTPEQAARLEELLDRVRRADLPQRFGAPPQANPRQISLAYGATESVLTLPPSGGKVADTRAKPVLDMAAAVKDMLGS
jgi:hypothetical protein